MSAAAVAGTPGVNRGNGSGPLNLILRHLDFVVLGVALPVFLLAGWPIAAWAVTAVVWFGQAVLIASLENRAMRSTEPRQQIGLMVGGGMARAWIAAFSILATGLIFGDDAGLACAILMIALFTIYFASKMLVHFTAQPTTKA